MKADRAYVGELLLLNVDRVCVDELLSLKGDRAFAELLLKALEADRAYVDGSPY